MKGGEPAEAALEDWPDDSESDFKAKRQSSDPPKRGPWTNDDLGASLPRHIPELKHSMDGMRDLFAMKGDALLLPSEEDESCSAAASEGRTQDPDMIQNGIQEAITSAAYSSDEDWDALNQIAPFPFLPTPSTTPSRETDRSSENELLGSRQSVEESDLESYTADSRSTAEDEAEDSISHGGIGDGVFSDSSPRSSLGLMSEAEQLKIEQTLSQRSITQRVRSPSISDMPHSDQDDIFEPAIRSSPRRPFKSPSSFKTRPVSSPPISVPGTPRSSRRTPLPTVSRLGSPNVSTQYSPKKTPPRFRRATPPLILLHATLLPLRWPWGELLDNAQPGELSQEASLLRESWRQLQDRTGDTISDRGILLPHPQSDYEVLEERLLEALELPMRRRARILECGHYLGPANATGLPDELESDEEEEKEDLHCIESMPSPRDDSAQKHWCRTCHSEIRYESLGKRKVFRVKVYASNGLMKSGAWEACWKEMERVDVELEPIVDGRLQDELNHLAAEKEESAKSQETTTCQYPERRNELCQFLGKEGEIQDDETFSTAPYSAATDLEDFRTREEARLREVYGHTPPPHARILSSELKQAAPDAKSTSTSHANETTQPQKQPQARMSSSLLELTLEALRIFVQDRKNSIITLLGILVFMLAVRGNSPQQTSDQDRGIVKNPDIPVGFASPATTAILPQQPVHASTASSLTEGYTSSAQSEIEALRTVTKTIVQAVTETITETVTKTIALNTDAEVPTARQCVSPDAFQIGMTTS